MLFNEYEVDVGLIKCSAFQWVFFVVISWALMGEYPLITCLRCSFGWLVCYSIIYQCRVFPELFMWLQKTGKSATKEMTEDMNGRDGAVDTHIQSHSLRRWFRYWRYNLQHDVREVLLHNDANLEEVLSESTIGFRIMAIFYAFQNGLEKVYGLTWKQIFHRAWDIFTHHYVIIICTCSLIWKLISIFRQYRAVVTRRLGEWLEEKGIIPFVLYHQAMRDQAGMEEEVQFRMTWME